jgi:hypothetical protein
VVTAASTRPAAAADFSMMFPLENRPRAGL